MATEVVTVPVSPLTLAHAIVAAEMPGVTELKAIRDVVQVAPQSVADLIYEMSAGWVAVFLTPLRIYSSAHDPLIVTSASIDSRVTLADNYALTQDAEFDTATFAGPIYEHIRIMTFNGTLNPVIITYELQLLKVEKSIYERLWRPLLRHTFRTLMSEASERGD